MKRKRCTPAYVAKRSILTIASLVIAATLNVASATPSTPSAGVSAKSELHQLVKLAEQTAVTKPKNVKRTSVPHKATRGPGTTWLNPQPEPPMAPAKVGSGGTWLNPQPEPPRPVTGAKKLH
jgi:hypothetical protein